MTVLVGVRLIDSTRQYDKTYTYSVPADVWPGNASDLIGRYVAVPFGEGREPRDAVVVETECTAGGVLPPGLKPVAVVRNDIPPLPGWAFGVSAFISERFYCTAGDALGCFLPAYIRSSAPRKVSCLRLVTAETEQEIIKRLRVKKNGTVKAIEALIAHGACELDGLRRATGINSYDVRRLVENRVAERIDTEGELPAEEPRHIIPAAPDRQLSGQQALAVSRIVEALESGEYRNFLLFGVTGSGKTEVYIDAIRRCAELGRGAIMAVPEISLTPQFIRRFETVFGDAVTALHSGLSDVERRRRWTDISRGRYGIVIGPRSALFAPVRNLGIIIIDEQHDSSYRSDQTPKYDTLQVAERIGQMLKIPVVQGSATPSVSSYRRAETGEMTLLTLTGRALDRPMPEVMTVDTRRDRGRPVTDTLLQAIADNRAAGGKTMLLLNRRGFATTVVCGECGRLVKCPRCGIRMHWHKGAGRLVCHYCGFTEPMPDKCGFCGSHELRQTGNAIQAVEEYLRTVFPEAPVMRLDSDRITYGVTQETVLSEFAASDRGILIGTQMISKGHDFPDVTLVGVMGIDSILQSDGFTGPENAFQLMTQTAGRAGRGDVPGRVLIETSEPDNFCVRAAINADYPEFYVQESLVRSRMGYPPYGEAASCCFVGKDDRRVYDCCLDFRDRVLSKYCSGDMIAGPARPMVPKQGGQYRWKLVVRRTEGWRERPLYRDLSAAADSREASGGKRDIRLYLDFDPESVIN